MAATAWLIATTGPTRTSADVLPRRAGAWIGHARLIPANPSGPAVGIGAAHVLGVDPGRAVVVADRAVAGDRPAEDGLVIEPHPAATRAPQVGPRQDGGASVRPIRPPEVGLVQRRGRQVRAAQVGAAEGGAPRGGVGQVGRDQFRVAEGRVADAGAGQVLTGQILPGEVAAVQVLARSGVGALRRRSGGRPGVAAGRGAAAVAVIDGPIGHDGGAHQGPIQGVRVSTQVRPREVGPGQTRLAPGAPPELGLAEGGSLQAGFGEDRAAAVGAVEVGPDPVDAAEDRAVEVLADEGAPGEVAVRPGAAVLGVRAALRAAARLGRRVRVLPAVVARVAARFAAFPILVLALAGLGQHGPGAGRGDWRRGAPRASRGATPSWPAAWPARRSARGPSGAPFAVGGRPCARNGRIVATGAAWHAAARNARTGDVVRCPGPRLKRVQPWCRHSVHWMLSSLSRPTGHSARPRWHRGGRPPGPAAAVRSRRQPPRRPKRGVGATWPVSRRRCCQRRMVRSVTPKVRVASARASPASRARSKRSRKSAGYCFIPTASHPRRLLCKPL